MDKLEKAKKERTKVSNDSGWAEAGVECAGPAG